MFPLFIDKGLFINSINLDAVLLATIPSAHPHSHSTSDTLELRHGCHKTGWQRTIAEGAPLGLLGDHTLAEHQATSGAHELPLCDVYAQGEKKSRRMSLRGTSAYVVLERSY